MLHTWHHQVLVRARREKARERRGTTHVFWMLEEGSILITEISVRPLSHTSALCHPLRTGLLREGSWTLSESSEPFEGSGSSFPYSVILEAGNVHWRGIGDSRGHSFWGQALNRESGYPAPGCHVCITQASDFPSLDLSRKHIRNSRVLPRQVLSLGFNS